MNTFDATLEKNGYSNLKAERPATLQVNVGRLCNLSCHHCHLGASPDRTEIMTWETMEAVLAFARSNTPCRVDITGGAPEMNPHFRRFVQLLRAEGFPVQVRTNLAVMLEPGKQDLPEFCQSQQVELVASLPCYLSDNVDAQRGDGVYEQSIAALKLLNQHGYGVDKTLPLRLVYNPGGPFLPPSQEMLEEAYRNELQERHGVVFTQLLTLTNMPIGRFLDDLRVEGKDQLYRKLLEDNFNPGTIEGLMCRHQVSIDWDGRLYDCDFNLALGLPLSTEAPRTIFEAKPGLLQNRPISTADHCFGCTAGSGSSCGGALVA